MSPKPKTAMTFAQLKAEIAKLNDDQLAMPVRWVGDERGGDIQALWVYAEEMISVGEGMEPASVYADDPDVDIEATWPAGTPVLCVDEYE